MKKLFDINDLIRKNVMDLSPYSSARDEYVSKGGDMIFLDANENPFENGVNRYPDPHQRRLKSILAEMKEVNESQIVLGNGSDEVLDLIFRAFCEPNIDNIITLPPTYGMYKVLAATNAIECREVLLNENFQPNNDEILNRSDENSKILFLCSPNNPTGNSFEKERTLELLLKFKGLVVVDEAYIDFSVAESWTKKLHDHPNLIVVQTLSKAYGMAGVRLGICYASEAIVSTLKKIKPPYNVNELTQKRAAEGLTDQVKVITQVSEILKERSKMESELIELGFIKRVYASDANFILAKVDDAQLRYDQLLKRGVVVRNRSSQPLCSNTLRLTIGTPAENKNLIQTLKELE